MLAPYYYSAERPERTAPGVLPDVEIGPEVEDPIGFILASVRSAEPDAQ